MLCIMESIRMHLTNKKMYTMKHSTNVYITAACFFNDLSVMAFELDSQLLHCFHIVTMINLRVYTVYININNMDNNYPIAR